MGTVVEKIRYIAGTKSAIRSAILKKGVEVGDEVTFRAYAEKIAEIEGGQSVAAYVFENSTQDGEFPLNALTSDKVQTYQDDESLKTWLETPTEDPAYMVLAADNINAFDKNVETYTDNYKIVWKFPTAVKARSFKTKVTNGYDNWRLYGSNNPLSVYNAWTGREYSDETGELLINTAERYQVLSEVTLSPKQPYQYYILTGAENGSCDLYEASLLATSGTVSCSLAEGNMTPTIRVYLEDYMQLITQPFYHEGEVIPSQTLVMKPYEEGGNLINYTDDGSAVDLKMYLLTGTDKPALYLLSPDDTFERPEGYADMTKTADLSLPAHICKKEIIGDFSQPALLANGTLGGDSFAVKADSELSAPYRAAWKAFDGNTVLADTGNDQWHSYSGQPHWLAFYNPYPLKVSSVTVYNGGDNVLPLDWKFQVSDNGTTWTDVASGTNTNTTAGSSWSFDITSPGWHKYHRFYTSSGQGRDGEYLGLTELQITALEKAERWVMGGA